MGSGMIKRVTGLSALSRMLRKRYTGWEQPEPFLRGHYYSPLPDVDEVARDRDRVFFDERRDLPGVEMDVAGQKALLSELAADFDSFDWPHEADGERRFYLGQGQFPMPDALVLRGMLRRVKPKRLIEVGSGHSSALMLDVAEREMDVSPAFTFIDPNPERLRSVLRASDDDRCRVIEKRVQDVGVELFDELGAGDVLFIDSSHVCRTASDVNFLFFEVLPRLAVGVVVHVHDVAWPFEYQESWVMEGRAFNESYLLRAFLQFNRAFKVRLFTDQLVKQEGDWVGEVAPGLLGPVAGSIWMERVGD